jgi:hypothetical protein
LGSSGGVALTARIVGTGVAGIRGLVRSRPQEYVYTTIFCGLGGLGLEEVEAEAADGELVAGLQFGHLYFAAVDGDAVEAAVV